MFVLLIGFLLGACSAKKDADKVADAQACLNSSTQATAMDCVSKVDGVETAAAYTVRCAAIFIRQGFSQPAFVAQAATQIKSGSGSSSTTAVMEAFEFRALSTLTENYNQSQTALDYCSRSSSKGLSFLATTASLATTSKYLTSVVSGCSSSADTATQLACLKNANDTAADTAVGTIVSGAYATNCSGAQAGANQALCDQFTTATSTCAPTDYACIGAKFLDSY